MATSFLLWLRWARRSVLVWLAVIVVWSSTIAALPASAAPAEIEVVATGYTAGVESTGKRPGHPGYGITYSGVKVRRDQVSTIAADPKLFPIGTLL